MGELELMSERMAVERAHSEVEGAVCVVIWVCGEVDGMTERIELLFFDVAHVKVLKSTFELVTKSVVSSDGGDIAAVFQIKFVVRFTTKAEVVGDTRIEKRESKSATNGKNEKVNWYGELLVSGWVLLDIMKKRVAIKVNSSFPTSTSNQFQLFQNSPQLYCLLSFRFLLNNNGIFYIFIFDCC